jgi:ATP-dependent DNA helicase RecQ
VLRQLARVRPTTPERMRAISGVGDVKLRDFAGRFLPFIAQHCREYGMATDLAAAPPGPLLAAAPRPITRPNARTQAARDLYRKGASIEDVMRELKYSRGTAVEHLAQYIREEKPASITAWVPEDVVQRVTAVVRQIGGGYLKPFYLALGEQVPYDDIRLVAAYLQSRR